MKKPHQVSFIRGDWLTVMFMVRGGLSDSRDSDSGLNVPAGTIWISGSPRSLAFFDPSPRLLAGSKVWIERQKLIDVFGLRVDNIPAIYRTIFTSGADGLEIELPMPSSAWAAVQQILQCGYSEPLRAEYQSARAVELICYVVAELNKLRPSVSRIGVSGATRERAGIENAAYIYRYEVSDPPSLDEVARRVGMNRNKLVAGFRERFGVTPYDYSRQIRLDRAQELLRGGALSVEQVAMACGYTSHAAFTRSFRQRYGLPPSQAGALDGGPESLAKPSSFAP